MLVRSSNIGVCFVLGPGLDFAERLACSLCCQQYKFSSLGSSIRRFPRERGGVPVAATGRLHGLPLDVIPLHVDAGFLESVRLTARASGVLAKMGIVEGGGNR